MSLFLSQRMHRNYRLTTTIKKKNPTLDNPQLHLWAFIAVSADRYCWKAHTIPPRRHSSPPCAPPEGRLEPGVGAAQFFLHEALGSRPCCEESWDVLYRPCERYACATSSTVPAAVSASTGVGCCGCPDPPVHNWEQPSPRFSKYYFICC